MLFLCAACGNLSDEIVIFSLTYYEPSNKILSYLEKYSKFLMNWRKWIIKCIVENIQYCRFWIFFKYVLLASVHTQTGHTPQTLFNFYRQAVTPSSSNCMNCTVSEISIVTHIKHGFQSQKTHTSTLSYEYIHTYNADKDYYTSSYAESIIPQASQSLTNALMNKCIVKSQIPEC